MSPSCLLSRNFNFFSPSQHLQNTFFSKRYNLELILCLEKWELPMHAYSNWAYTCFCGVVSSAECYFGFIRPVCRMAALISFWHHYTWYKPLILCTKRSNSPNEKLKDFKQIMYNQLLYTFHNKWCQKQNCSYQFPPIILHLVIWILVSNHSLTPFIFHTTLICGLKCLFYYVRLTYIWLCLTAVILIDAP